MVKCNRERLKEFDSQFTVLSDFDIEDNCEQILTDADNIKDGVMFPLMKPEDK